MTCRRVVERKRVNFTTLEMKMLCVCVRVCVFVCSLVAPHPITHLESVILLVSIIQTHTYRHTHYFDKTGTGGA